MVETVATRCRKGIKEIIFIFYFLTDIFLRNIGGNAHCLFGVFYGVVDRPVPSPTAYQSFVI